MAIHRNQDELEELCLLSFLCFDFLILRLRSFLSLRGLLELLELRRLRFLCFFLGRSSEDGLLLLRSSRSLSDNFYLVFHDSSWRCGQAFHRQSIHRFWCCSLPHQDPCVFESCLEVQLWFSCHWWEYCSICINKKLLYDCLRGILPFLVFDKSETIFVVVAALDYHWVQFAKFWKHWVKLWLKLGGFKLNEGASTSTSRLVAKILWGVGLYYASGDRLGDWELDDIRYNCQQY